MHHINKAWLLPPWRSSKFRQKPWKILNVKLDSVRVYQSISAVIFLLCHALNMHSRTPIDTQLSCLWWNLNGTERSGEHRPSAKEAASPNTADVKHTCAQATMDIYIHNQVVARPSSRGLSHQQEAESAYQLAQRTAAALPLQFLSK